MLLNSVALVTTSEGSSVQLRDDSDEALLVEDASHDATVKQR